ncbi:hypothetical protein O181_055158 [Austropuccinia psidii MF-1]|uniref:Uncharacterized protein n=1 Tax=Austropuccinia psidii MF-1 TaxID=1389203 RepID=A0A9Q3EAL7_9BASI|nr:hypothetical protein [Austropuccinia psidii MF-1]
MKAGYGQWKGVIAKRVQFAINILYGKLTITWVQCPQVDTIMPPLIYALTTSHASAPLPHLLCIQSFFSSSALNPPYHPYACVVPSQHAANAALAPA